VSGKVFPLGEVISMPEDNTDGRDRLPESKKEEQDHLSKVANLAPLLDLVIRILELLLKILRIIN
jgi:hypothetical protein